MKKDNFSRLIAGYSLLETLSYLALVAGIGMSVLPEVEQRNFDTRIEGVDATANIILKAMGRHYRRHCASGAIPAITVDGLVSQGMLDYLPQANPIGSAFTLEIDTDRASPILRVSSTFNDARHAARVSGFNSRAGISATNVVWEINHLIGSGATNLHTQEANNMLNTTTNSRC